ncbi:histidine phosphatase family protein [Burkholderia stagnalis]
MPVSLYLIAHASTRAMRTGTFPDDDPLDARGLDEAAACRAREWANVGGARVLCSPARCARQTADALGLRADIDAALRDIDYGSWRGRRLPDLGRDCPTALDAWIGDAFASPHGGESFADALHRTGAWLDGLRAECDIVAITHAAIVRAAITHARRAAPGTMAGLDVAPVSCTTFTRLPDGWRVAAAGGLRHEGSSSSR